jgi:hypothetical protein
MVGGQAAALRRKASRGDEVVANIALDPRAHLLIQGTQLQLGRKGPMSRMGSRSASAQHQVGIGRGLYTRGRVPHEGITVRDTEQKGKKNASKFKISSSYRAVAERPNCPR